MPNFVAAVIALALTFALAAGITRLAARLVRRSRMRPSLQSAMVTLTRIGV